MCNIRTKFVFLIYKCLTFDLHLNNLSIYFFLIGGLCDCASCQPRTKLKTYGERSFQYAAPNEWNNLPLIIRESPSLAIFKNKLKTFLFHSTYST